MSTPIFNTLLAEQSPDRRAVVWRAVSPRDIAVGTVTVDMTALRESIAKMTADFRAGLAVGQKSRAAILRLGQEES